MSEGILEEISELREKCNSLNAEIKDYVISHSIKQKKIQKKSEINDEISNLIEEMDNEINLFHKFDKDSALNTILQLESEIEKQKKKKNKMAFEGRRLQNVYDIKMRSIYKQNIHNLALNISHRNTLINSPSKAALIALRHELDSELNNLNESNAPNYQIFRKRAQIMLLLDISN